jgi:hypothetical protein
MLCWKVSLKHGVVSSMNDLLELLEDGERAPVQKVHNIK